MQPLDWLNPINHGVLIVGYGTDEATGLEYYLVKNSWNTTWGDKGYVKIKMSVDDEESSDIGDGICGISLWHYWPVLG